LHESSRSPGATIPAFGNLSTVVWVIAPSVVKAQLLRNHA
jgi:hypothetical protein